MCISEPIFKATTTTTTSTSTTTTPSKQLNMSMRPPPKTRPLTKPAPISRRHLHPNENTINNNLYHQHQRISLFHNNQTKRHQYLTQQQYQIQLKRSGRIVRASEYRNLRQVVPALRRQRDIGKVEVVTEAARYIDHLHKTLIERFVLGGIPDSLKDILGTDDANELSSQHIMNLVTKMAANQRQQQQQPNATRPSNREGAAAVTATTAASLAATNASRRHGIQQRRTPVAPKVSTISARHSSLSGVRERTKLGKFAQLKLVEKVGCGSVIKTQKTTSIRNETKNFTSQILNTNSSSLPPAASMSVKRRLPQQQQQQQQQQIRQPTVAIACSLSASSASASPAAAKRDLQLTNHESFCHPATDATTKSTAFETRKTIETTSRSVTKPEAREKSKQND